MTRYIQKQGNIRHVSETFKEVEEFVLKMPDKAIQQFKASMDKQKESRHMPQEFTDFDREPVQQNYSNSDEQEYQPKGNRLSKYAM